MKQRFPRDAALAVAECIIDELRPACSRIVIAGSLRRGKPDVGDIEIVYVGLTQEQPDPTNMFATIQVDLTEPRIAALEVSGVLARRRNAIGRESYGRFNKLMIHSVSGIPVDLFATTEGAWWNYLVCRTGPAESNTLVATAAKAKGWHWNPYGSGFSAETGLQQSVDSEEAVFAFVGLPYREPAER